MQVPAPAALLNNRLRDLILAGIALFLLVHHGLPALRALAQEGSAAVPREALSTAFTY